MPSTSLLVEITTSAGTKRCSTEAKTLSNYWAPFVARVSPIRMAPRSDGGYIMPQFSTIVLHSMPFDSNAVFNYPDNTYPPAHQPYAIKLYQQEGLTAIFDGHCVIRDIDKETITLELAEKDDYQDNFLTLTPTDLEGVWGVTDIANSGGLVQITTDEANTLETGDIVAFDSLATAGTELNYTSASDNRYTITKVDDTSQDKFTLDGIDPGDVTLGTPTDGFTGIAVHKFRAFGEIVHQTPQNVEPDKLVSPHLDNTEIIRVYEDGVQIGAGKNSSTALTVTGVTKSPTDGANTTYTISGTNHFKPGDILQGSGFDTESVVWAGTGMFTTGSKTESMLYYDGVIWATTFPNSAIYKSDDNGVTWQKATDVGSGITLTQIEVSGGNIFVGASDGKVYKTTNGGATWAATTTITGSTNVIGLMDVSGTLFAGVSGSSNAEVHKTTDGGTTWVKQDDLTNATTIYDFYNDSGTYYAATDDADTPIYKSTDSGATWTATGTISGSSLALTLTKVSTTLFASVYSASWSPANGRVYKSTDSGSTWTQATEVTGNPDIVNLVAAFDGDLFIGGAVDLTDTTGGSNSFIYKSEDLGGTWISTGSLGDANSVTTLYDANGTLYAGVVDVSGNTNETVRKATVITFNVGNQKVQAAYSTTVTTNLNSFGFVDPNTTGTLDFDSVFDTAPGFFIQLNSTPSGTLTISGTASDGTTVNDFFSALCTDLSLTLDATLAPDSSTDVLGFYVTEQTRLIDLASEVAKAIAHQFYIEGTTLYLVDKANTPQALEYVMDEDGTFLKSEDDKYIVTGSDYATRFTKADIFRSTIDYPKPVANTSTSWQTKRAKETSGGVPEIFDYTVSYSEDSATFKVGGTQTVKSYNQEVRDVQGYLSTLQTIAERPIAVLTIHGIDGDVKIGWRVDYYDDEVETSVSLFVREIEYDYEQLRTTFKGDATLSSRREL